VSVTVVTALNTGSEQVRIIGEIPHPQSVLYRKDMTLLDLVLTAGGLTNVADGNNAILIRGSEGDKKYSLRVKDLVKGGDMSANVPVMPGDIVTIPQSTF
jgi:polysaccharide export outer membrane protein